MSEALFVQADRSVHVLSVRSFCPFCASNDDLAGAACCQEWAALGGETFEPVLPVVGARRFNEASRPLVTMIASSIVAMLVSFGMQSRAPADAAIDATPIRASVAPVALAQVPATLQKPEVVPPAPAELVAPTSPEPESKPIQDIWSADDLGKWQHLRRGMSRTAVRSMLGYPQWIDRGTTPHTEYWLYGSEQLGDGAWIAFLDGEGPVAEWRRP